VDYCEDIFVLGDVHGDFRSLTNLINRKHPRIVLQCGDFGYWPSFKVKNHRGVLKDSRPRIGETKLYWCEGNHEDYSCLRAHETSEVYPNVFHMGRGSTLALPDGRTVLFMGGALSVDKAWRTPGYDWFPEETITTSDLDRLPDVHVDIVISHTCPAEFEILDEGVLARDSCQQALSHVLAKYHPALWYFGHFHRFKKGCTMGCRWTALTMAGCSNWWEHLAAS
jgi:hypothetical protein